MQHDKKFLWLLFAALTVGSLEFLAWAGMRLPLGIEIPFFLIFIAAVGHQTLWHGLKALVRLDFESINALMTLAVAGAWYLGKYEEAAVVIVLYSLAERLEDLGIEKSRSAWGDLLESMPKHLFLKNRDRQVPIDEVQVGEVMGIKPGERIALDGKVVSGVSFVDESTITGEPIPQEKFPGDTIYAGTWNKQGYLEVEVLKISKETTFAKIQELTLQAERAQAPTQQFIERFSRYYTPAVILLAFLWIFVPYAFFGYPFAPGLAEGLSLIVIACPCALVLSTPVSIYSAIGNASKQGILIKGGKYLEAIGRIKAMALDKTRTLTYGRPVVSAIIPYGDRSKQQLLECAAGIELFSEHPLAQSIVEAAKKENVALHPVENFIGIPGKGAQADCLVCSDRAHRLGKLPFILETHAVPPLIVDQVEALQKEGKTPILIATSEEIEGIIALEDEVRPSSKQLIEELKTLGIVPILLTGDHPFAARAVADQLGITEAQAELLPEGKAEAMRQLLQQYGTVAMAGDGINDAPALALSSVGIAIGSMGSDAAMEAAAIVMLHDRLELLPFLVRLGRKTSHTIRLNIGLALTIKLLFVALALLGMSNLALAIFADTGVTFLVTLMGLRLMNWRQPPKGRCTERVSDWGATNARSSRSS